MQFLVIGLTLLAFFSLAYTTTDVLEGGKFSVKNRLRRLRRREADDSDAIYSKPFSERILKPVLDELGKRMLKLAPAETVNTLEKKIVMAGRPYGLTARNWLALQAVFTICLPFLLLLVSLQAGADAPGLLMLSGAAAAIGILLPNLILNSSIRERQKSILKSMPDVMDLLTVSVEAGLGFDAALAKVVEKMPGTLSKEFQILLSEIRIGKTRKEAMYQMADRVGIQDFRSFTSAIVQAEQLGVSMGRIMRIQSEQIRQNRRQRIQEKAMKAPIKMLIPMVIFVFPSIFIVLLGPTVINLIGMFASQM